MATKTLPVIPPFVPGQGMAELVKRQELVAKADAVNYNSATAVNIFELSGGELILGLVIDVVTAFDASGTSAAASATIEVPGSTGAIVVWDAANTGLQTATTDVMLPSTNGSMIKVPASGGNIVVKQEPGTTTAGSIEVYLRYFPDNSKL